MSKVIAPTVVHVMGPAGPAGTAQLRFLTALRPFIAPDRYRQLAWFTESDRPTRGSLAELGLPSRLIRFAGVKDPAGMVRIARALFAERPEIVHLHVGGGTLAWLARHAAGSSVLAHLWASHTDDGRPLSLSSFTANADAVIGTSNYVASLVSTPVTVVYPATVPTDVQVGVKPGPPWLIGTAGRLVPVKGYRYLLSALQSLRGQGVDARVELAGSGRQERALRNLAAELGISSAVDFLGWQKNLTSLFRRWHVFALPSMSEGFGLAVQEAMAGGLPVVASAVGGLTELVEDGETGYLVEPGKPDLLAERLAKLLSDDQLRASMGSAGRERVRRFQTAVTAERVLAVYDELMRDRVGRSPSQPPPRPHPPAHTL